MDGSLYVVDASTTSSGLHALPPLTTTKGVPAPAPSTACARCSSGSSASSGPTTLRGLRRPRPHVPRRHLPRVTGPPAPDAAELAAQVELLHKVIATFNIPSLTVPGVEADDAIATLACQGAAAGLRVVIRSSDKDLMQLCNDASSCSTR